MGLYYEQMARDLQQVESILDNQAITRKDRDYVCIIGPIERGVTIDPKTGNEVAFTQKVLLRKEVANKWGWTPGVGEIISVPEPLGDKKTERKINLVTGQGVYWVLHLIDQGK